MSSEVDRLGQALNVYWQWRGAPGGRPATQLLAANEPLREYLEPLLREQPDPAPAIEQLGDFVIHRELGRGGMGVVYEATQKSLGRRAALKVLPIGPWTTPSHKARFQREGELAARLTHPGIARVLAAGTTDDRRYYAMDLVVGASLDRALAQLDDGVASQRRGTELGCAVLRAMGEHPDEAALHPFWSRSFVHVVCDIVRQVADALQHAHEHGVLHRDVKPSNIVLRPDGRAVLVDFGLAREFDAPWQTNEPAGTPHYMPPEIARHEVDRIDARSDVYSLGASLFQALCGEPPFPGQRSVQVLRLIENGVPVSPRRRDPGLQKDLVAVCLRALERQPQHRYQTARAFADDLRNLLDHRPVAARPPSAARRFSDLIRRHPVVAIAASVLFLAGSVFTAVALTLLDSEREAWRRAQAADYRAKVRAASSAIERDNPTAAVQMLAASPEALRGWEWRHLDHRLHAGTMQLHSEVPLRGQLCATEASRALVWSASDDGSVRAFSPEDGAQQLRVVLPDGRRATSLSRYARGGVLACVTERGDVFCLDSRGGTVMRRHRFEGAQTAQPVADGSLLVATDRLVMRVRADDTRVTLFELPEHTVHVHELLATADGAFVAARTEDTRARKPDPVVCWLADGRHELLHPEGFAGGTVIGARRELVLVSRHGDMLVFPFGSERPSRVVETSRNEVLDVVAHGDGLAVLGKDAVVRVHHGKELEHEVSLPHLSPGDRLAAAPSGAWVAATHDDAEAVSIHRQPAGVRALDLFDGFVHHVIWSPDDTRLAAATVYGEPSRLQVFDTDSWRQVAAVDGAKPQRFSDDAGQLLCDNGSVFDVVAGNMRRLSREQRTGPATREQLLAFCRDSHSRGEQLDHYTAMSPDRTLLARVAWFGGPTVEVSRLVDGEVVARLVAAGRQFRGVTFSPDGTTLATCDRAGEVSFWDSDTFARRPRSLPHPDTVFDVAWSPDGDRIVTACKDAVVRIFDPESLELLLELTGHDAYVRAVAWSHDGTRLASASADGTVRIWDTRRR